jgi:hypothetical protein
MLPISRTVKVFWHVTNKTAAIIHKKVCRHLEGLQILDTTKFIDAVHQFKKGNKWVSYGDISRVFITEKWLSSQFGELQV